MAKLIDLTGQKFGRLTVIKKAGFDNFRRIKWLCKCDCGNTVVVTSYNLINQNTKSCGCLRKEISSERLSKHNKSKTRIYRIWCNIKKRCNDKKQINFKYYGARGIKVCQEWENNFMNFYNWSINNGYKDDLTIDRIDVNGNYAPDNCRWATYFEQNLNKRNTRYIKFNDEVKTIKDWAKILMINENTIRTRLARGYSVEKALTRNKYNNYMA